MNVSARLALPLLVPGQAQKEMFHNEALQLLDFVIQPIVEAMPADVPPGSAEPGQSYLVGPSPTGAWTAHPNALVCMTDGGWRFFRPFQGMEVKLRSTGERVSFVTGAWQLGVLDVREVRVGGERVLSARASTISGPVGGSTVDAEARTVLSAVLDALRHHGLIALA